MEEHIQPIREKQYHYKMEIRKDKLQSFIAARRQHNSSIIENNIQHLQLPSI